MIPTDKAMLGLRVVQIVSAIIAFITALAGDVNNCTFGTFSFDSQSEINFLVANGFLVAICVPVWAYVFEIKKLRELPHRALPLAFDFVWLIFAFSGAIAAAVSPLIEDVCANEATRNAVENVCDIGCGSLRASIVFTFFIFFASLVLIFMASRQYMATNATEELGYQNSATPRVEASTKL